MMMGRGGVEGGGKHHLTKSDFFIKFPLQIEFHDIRAIIFSKGGYHPGG